MSEQNVNPDGTPYTGALIVLVPAESDPVVAASAEPAHITTIWFGEMADLPVDVDELEQSVRLYAQDLDGPVVVPVAERGTLGSEGADVVFLEKTDSLIALRDGLLANEPIRQAHDAVEQFPEWTPHVTLGYPDRPALGEYDADSVTFDRVSLWLGGEHYDYPMGGTAVTAAATIDEEIEIDDEMPLDELEDGEELITEIPVHGVATLEGKPTRDGRQFDAGALGFASLPQPLGYEFESGHGSDNSRVAFPGRIDEFWTAPYVDRETGAVVEGVFEARWRGVVFPHKEYAAELIEGIIDGSRKQLSVIIDGVTVNVEAEREELAARLIAERDGMGNDAADGVSEKPAPRTDEQIMALVDEFIGDGKQRVQRYSEARIRRFDVVPTGAFDEGYIALGHAFEDELTDEDREALAACDCADTDSIADAPVLDLTELTDEELAHFGTLSEEGGIAWLQEKHPEAVLAGASFAPGTKDGPGWITNPIATKRIRDYWVRGKGAAKIRWGLGAPGGDFNRCRKQLAKYVQNPDWLAGLCANMHKEATGFWPGSRVNRGASLAASASAAAPLFVLAAAVDAVDDGHKIWPAWAFEEPEDIGRAFGMQIDRETRTIFGYAAQWGVCHVGITGMCQEPPKSPTDYSYFRKGVVDTDAGEQRVALITYGIGHAGQHDRAAAATAHYDQTDAVRAYINIGENAYGIWFAGVLAPWVTDADIDAMRAIGRVSGDWRNWSGRPFDLEMVGLVVVNTEGFQLAASGGVQTAAIGIGSLPKETDLVVAGGGSPQGPRPALTAAAPVTVDDMVGIAVAAAEQVLHRQKREQLAAKAAPARATIKQQSLASARARIKKG